MRKQYSFTLITLNLNLGESLTRFLYGDLLVSWKEGLADLSFPL